MGKLIGKHWLRAVISVGWLFSISWVAFAQQAAPPADSSKVDWSLFLPTGEGKFQTAIYCSTCHSLQLTVVQDRDDEAGWEQTNQKMVQRYSASIENDDIAAISKYLARFFSPSTPKLELPININTAPKETLVLLGSLSEADVQKILDARTKGKIKDFAALEAIVGANKLSKYNSFISFDGGSEKSK